MSDLPDLGYPDKLPIESFLRPPKLSPEADAAFRANITCVACRDENEGVACTCAFRCGWRECVVPRG